jgi:hypothetical protein
MHFKIYTHKNFDTILVKVLNIKMFHGTKKSAPGVSNIKSKFESDKGTST